MTARDAAAQARAVAREATVEGAPSRRFGERAPITIAVDCFEVVAATPRHRLLRLHLRTFTRPWADPAEVRLVVGDRRIAPLPDPAQPRLEPGEIMGGFAVPAELMGDEPVELLLDLGGGRLVPLPEPTDARVPVRDGRFARRLI